MPTDFPTGLDAFTAKKILDLEDAIQALQAKVGIDASTDASSIDNRLSGKQDSIPPGTYADNPTPGTPKTAVVTEPDTVNELVGGQIIAGAEPREAMSEAIRLGYTSSISSVDDKGRVLNLLGIPNYQPIQGGRTSAMLGDSRMDFLSCSATKFDMIGGWIYDCSKLGNWEGNYDVRLTQQRTNADGLGVNYTVGISSIRELAGRTEMDRLVVESGKNRTQCYSKFVNTKVSILPNTGAVTPSAPVLAAAFSIEAPDTNEPAALIRALPVAIGDLLRIEDTAGLTTARVTSAGRLELVPRVAGQCLAVLDAAGVVQASLSNQGQLFLNGQGASSTVFQVSGAGLSRWKFNKDGIQYWDDGTGAFDTMLRRAATGNKLQTDDQFAALDGIITKYLAGAGKVATADGDFATTPVNGMVVVLQDTTDGTTRLAVRAANVWKTTPALA